MKVLNGIEPHRNPLPQPGTGKALFISAVAGMLLLTGQLTGVAADSSSNGDALSASGITRAVETDMVADSSVAAHLIDARTSDGVVTLSGSVDNLLSKERAVTIAQSIRGVRSVVDRIKVNPAPRPDAEIREDVRMALVRDPATDSFEVAVSVDDGMVTLTGDVGSWQERRLSGQVAKGVRGVTGLTNNIRWDWSEDRVDLEVEAEIERRLESDIWVDARHVDVEVDGDSVTLDGSVGSAIEKTYATSGAWVTGVREVNADGLEVNPWLRDEARRTTARNPVKSDEAIARAVKDAFLYDPRVASFNPDVTVADGTVTLTGTVENLAARRAAERDARNTVGVWNVVNLLKVRQADPPTDVEIVRDINHALEASPFVDRFDVTATVLNRKAFLSGTADSTFEKTEAERLASGVRGVVDVRNNIVVVDSAHAYPESGYFSYLGRPLMYQPLNQSRDHDLQIERNVISQLFWSPYVDAGDIEVSVESGVATLTGTVESRAERGAAIDNAYQGGASGVYSELEIVDESDS